MFMRNTTILVVLVAASVAMLAPEAEAQGPPQIRQVPAYSGNYTRRASRAIRRIVIHTVEGSEASCVSWFQNPRARVSAHYVVSHAGRITQMVPDMSVAWHATSFNADSIGIENEGYASRDGWTAAQYAALAHLVRSLCDRYGIPITRQAIVGHYQVPGSGKVDPGRYFEWDRFLDLVRGAPATPRPAPSAPTSGGSSSGGAGPATAGRFGVEVTADVLNVRATPGGVVLGQVQRGDRFVVTQQTSGWLRIDWRGTEAWISATYARRVTGQAVVVTASALNVRATPSTSGGLLGQTARGQVHFRLGQSGDWVLIQFDQRQAWVHGDYTTPVSL
jgi:N-acetylmuramoyl-L-alanine amidase CwlA